MISQAAEYSLRAAICLATRKGQPLTTQQIAELACIPSGYLAKVLQLLARAGIVESQRGTNGGFALRTPPEKVTLMEIVSVVDPSRRIATCPLGIKHEGGALCPLHRRLDQAAEAAEEPLRKTTLAQLLKESSDILFCNQCPNAGRSE